MKHTEILKVDSRGRIVIPRSMRKSLGLGENAQIMAISDSENKEIKLIPLPFTNEGSFMKIQIFINDESGSLARIASIFGELGLSLLYGETVVIKKGEQAEWTVISPTPEISLEEFVEILEKKGGALKVNILEPKTYIYQSD